MLELGLVSTETELKEQRHLIARILLYGHEHLITHLYRIERERKKTFLRILRTLDYETIDLVRPWSLTALPKHHKWVESKNPTNLSQVPLPLAQKFLPWKPFWLRKTLTSRQKNNTQKKTYSFLYSVAIILFVGGSSSRFVDENGFIQDKAFYREHESQDCLL